MNKLINYKFKIGDKVQIITGKYKNFIGTILKILKKKSKIILTELSPRIKYIKSTQENIIKQKELPYLIHFSNIMNWDSHSNKKSKLSYKFEKNIKKRFFKKSGYFI